MLIDHEGRRPRVHPSAYVAPTAVLCGDIRVGPDCRVLFGAVLTDDGGPVELGESSIVMETAVLRGTRRDPSAIGFGGPGCAQTESSSAVPCSSSPAAEWWSTPARIVPAPVLLSPAGDRSFWHCEKRCSERPVGLLPGSPRRRALVYSPNHRIGPQVAP